MACSIYETVLSAFEENDEERLRNVYDDLRSTINVSRMCSVEELLTSVSSASSALGRNFGAEKFIPEYATKENTCTAVR